MRVCVCVCVRVCVRQLLSADLITLQSTGSRQDVPETTDISCVGIREEVVAKFSSLFLFLEVNDDVIVIMVTHRCYCRGLPYCRRHGKDPRDNV